MVDSRHPTVEQYDDGLGIDPEMLSYIHESHEIQSRISSTPCYLLQRKLTGDASGSVQAPLTIVSYSETTPNYRAIIWQEGGSYPDLRVYLSNFQQFFGVIIDGVFATYVLAVEDLVQDSEFCVVLRKDVSPQRVELVFNAGFIATDYVIQLYYHTAEVGITFTNFQRGDSSTQSLFGWQQYLNFSTDAYRSMHQILVRLPMTLQDDVINEEGRVRVKDINAWMTGRPRVRDFDLLIAPAQFTTSGVEERYEITNKTDSIIQKRLLSQRFQIHLIEPSDSRYFLPYITGNWSGSVVSGNSSSNTTLDVPPVSPSGSVNANLSDSFNIDGGSA